MEMWVTVKNAAGVIQGGGPITSATNWFQESRLDEAGTWSFDMPASDARWRLIQPFYTVECYTVIDGAIVQLGGGVVEDVSEEIGTPSMIRVSGSDLLRELSYYPVGALDITEKGYTYLNSTNGSVAQLKPTYFEQVDPIHLKHYKSGYYNRAVILYKARDANAATEDNYTVLVGTEQSQYVPDTYNLLYIGCDKPYGKIKITIGSVVNSTVNATIDYQYYAGATGWTSIASVTDGTMSGGKPFAQSGVISFTEPADWERIQGINGLGNWFWVRARIILTDPWTPYYVSFRLKEVECYVDLPTDTGVELITNRAVAYNANWTACTDTTTNDAYLTFNGESVLTALQTLARATGDHFILGAGRTITWLGAASTWSASGYTAVGAGERQAGYLLISGLTRRRMAGDLITRITPLAGNEEHEINLSKTTRTAAAGYTLSKAPPAPTQPWLKHDAAETAYGKISRVERFDNIAAMNAESWYLDPANAANQLFDAAKLYLDNRRAITYEYELEVVGFEPYAVTGATSLLTPGTTIHVVYQEYRDGTETIDINTYSGTPAPLYIMAVRYNLGEDGVLRCGLTLSTGEMLRRQAADDIADAIASMRY
jgi:hypothetical protein